MNQEFNSELYQHVFEQFPMARLLVKVCDNGRYEFADLNKPAEAYFEYKRDQMIGMTARERFKDKQLTEQMEQAFIACHRAKKPVAVNTLPRFPGGVKVQSFVLNPVVQDDEVILIDVIARPEAEDMEQVQRERDDAILLLTSLFDATGVGIMVTDHHGRIVRVNETFLQDYGYEPAEMIGEEFTVMIPPEDQDLSRKLHAAFIERGRQGSREVQILKKDGNIADVWLTTVLLELSQRRRFMVATARDITERKNMIRRLRQAKEAADSANRAKSVFLANMSHELRTPLNAIIGFSEVMQNETFGPIQVPKYAEYLTDIHFSARHLLDIINDVLDMSKIEAGKVELVESDVCISELMRSVEMIMCARATQAGIKLIFDVEEGLPCLKSDQRFMRQIIINLLSNSIKFSPAHSNITVTAHRLENRHLRISVTDQGCGIAQDMIETVMEPFGQSVDSTQYNQGQGTGLGLPLAKAMVELHGGDMTIDSKVNIGTTIYLDFPLERMVQKTPIQVQEELFQ